MMELLGQHLKTVGTSKLFRKHASIFFQGEVPRYGFLVVDGIVKSYTTNAEGDEAILHLFSKGSIIPSAWVNNQMSTSMSNYEALSDVRGVAFTKQDLYAALESNREYEKEYRENLSKTQAALLLRITGLIQNRAIEKICYALYYLTFRYGIEKQPGIYEINLKLTQEMLAQLIGQTRESTAKNLKLLEQSGIVSYTSSTYFVNKQKLEYHLGDDTFKDLKS